MIDLTEVRRELFGQAYLFDDPHAYEAGVDDALHEVTRVLSERHQLTIDLTSDRPTLRVAAT